jgi:hypothetical protein
MSGKPKYSILQPCIERSKKTNGNRLRLRAQPDGRGRQTKVKVAQFFVLVALLSVLADHLSRVQERTDANLGPDSISLVNLILYPSERLGNSSGFTVRFRLSNKGNHSVFYPTDTATNVPVGQLVARASSTSDWMSLSSTSEQRVRAVEKSKDSNLMWIEMPPGGWVDSEFQDVGESPEEHAFVIYVKVARDGNGIRIVSKPYPSLANQ